MTPSHATPLPEPTPTATGGPAPLAPLVRAIALALVATTAGLAAVLALVDRHDWWRGLLAATLVSALSAAVSLVPLGWGLRRGGTNHRAAAFFVAMGARAAISLGGCALAVMIGNYPPAPTLLLMVVFYFVILTVETTAVARTLWTASD